MNPANVESMVNRRFNKYKVLAETALEHGRTDATGFYLYKAAHLMYQYNTVYYDCDLESDIGKLAKSMGTIQCSPNIGTVMIVDTFGKSLRVLAWQYAKAIVDLNLKLVFVVSKQSSASSDFDLLEHYLNENGCIITYFDDDMRHFSRSVTSLRDVIAAYSPEHLLFHGKPWDVISLTSINSINGPTKYLINLTDHAFWLGSTCFDCFLEFREYGRSISVWRRGIEDNKEAYLPYYPAQTIVDTPFEGLPFKESTDFFVAGGTGYKIQGSDKFQIMVESILQDNEDIVFLWLSNDVPSSIEMLIAKFPTRVYHQPERQDFFEVCKRALFLLQTYPIYGALITQIAAQAGIVPITLLLEGTEPAGNLLSEEQNVGIDFTTIDDAVYEAKRLIEDVGYREERRHEISSTIVTPADFSKRLGLVLMGERQGFSHERPARPEDESFRQTYLARCSSRLKFERTDYHRLDATHPRIWNPYKVSIGLSKIKNKVRKAMN